MRVDEYIQTSRIALAFINVNDCVNQDSLGRLKALHTFLKNRSDIVSLLGFVHIVSDDVTVRIEPLVKKFNLEGSEQRLLTFLIKSDTTTLLLAVLLKIITEIEHRLGFLHFDITSSHTLSGDDCVNLEAFLEKKMQAKIIPIYSINKDLICGIRVKGERMVWEYSLAQSLQSLIFKPNNILE